MIVTPTTEPITYPRPRPVNMRPVKWVVLSKEHKGPATAALDKHGALIAVSAQGYEALSENMADILRYLEQTDALLEAYEHAPNP